MTLEHLVRAQIRAGHDQDISSDILYLDQAVKYINGNLIFGIWIAQGIVVQGIASGHGTNQPSYDFCFKHNYQNQMHKHDGPNKTRFSISSPFWGP